MTKSYMVKEKLHEAAPMEPPKRLKKKAEKEHRLNFRPMGEDADERYEQEIDSNVMSINFDVLKELGEIASGDPVFCGGCRAVLNSNSVLLDRDQLKKLKAGEALDPIV